MQLCRGHLQPLPMKRDRSPTSSRTVLNPLATFKNFLRSTWSRFHLQWNFRFDHFFFNLATFWWLLLAVSIYLRPFRSLSATSLLLTWVMVARRLQTGCKLCVTWTLDLPRAVGNSDVKCCDAIRWNGSNVSQVVYVVWFVHFSWG